MSAESSGVFTLKEINRIKIIQDVIERRITTRRAAEHLGISDRQCRRLLARYREGGPLVWPADDVACVVTASCHPGSQIRLWN
ncbi:Putative transposase (identified by ISEscan HMM) [Klebsiella variicola]|nr:Putative transposase (identified by ISEscan HMM) [Klebsiella variicola]